MGTMQKGSKIYVAGHAGLIGSAMVRCLQDAGYQNIVVRTRDQLELQDTAQVASFFEYERPQYVVLAAGRVGGILENQTLPADFINENLAISLNVLRSAHHTDVRKLILFGSSCMYPRECPQPMAEEVLLSGKPESTSLPYAIAKLAGVHLCLAYNRQYGEQRFIPVIPNSAYGPNDNFDSGSGHVLSALMTRFHQAKLLEAPSVELWGSGSPRREFVHADDIALACLYLLGGDFLDMPLPLNIGTGQDISIKELAVAMAEVVGYRGHLLWDSSKPDGAPRKLLDSERIKRLGWQAQIDLETGLRSTYDWFLRHQNISPR